MRQFVVNIWWMLCASESDKWFSVKIYLRRLLCCLDAVSFTSNKVISAAALYDSGDTLITLISNEISHSTILHLTPCCLNKTDMWSVLKESTHHLWNPPNRPSSSYFRRCCGFTTLVTLEGKMYKQLHQGSINYYLYCATLWFNSGL